MIENLFLSVGAMKAGTTWLYEQLKDHPDVHFTPEKEIHYFANVVGIENQLDHKNRIEKLKYVLNKYCDGNLRYISENAEEIAWYSEFARPKNIDNDWYKNLFRFNPGKKFCADFSNLYCQMDSEGWKNVRNVAKNVKIIYTLRDPIERLWSHYKFHMKWIDREDEALDAGFDNFKGLMDKHFFWVNAEYAKNYKLLQSSLSNDEIMVLYFEDFREKPEEMLVKVLSFLEVDGFNIKKSGLNKKVNQTKKFYLPEEWEDYMKKKLDPVVSEVKDLGLWHPKWNSF